MSRIFELSEIRCENNPDARHQRQRLVALLHAGADVNAADKNGVTALHHAVRFRDSFAVLGEGLSPSMVLQPGYVGVWRQGQMMPASCLTGGAKMHSRIDSRARKWARIVFLVCSLIIVGYAIFRLGSMSYHSWKVLARPQEFAGDWLVEGIQGDSRGIMTFAPDGRVDSGDDYSGEWWLESGRIHVQFWGGDSPHRSAFLFPKRQEFIFAVTRNQENLPSVIRGAHVILKRAGEPGS